MEAGSAWAVLRNTWVQLQIRVRVRIRVTVKGGAWVELQHLLHTLAVLCCEVGRERVLERSSPVLYRT